MFASMYMKSRERKKITQIALELPHTEFLQKKTHKHQFSITAHSTVRVLLQTKYNNCASYAK